MSFSQLTHRIAENHHRNRDQRALARAIENAPTPASRQELEAIARR